MIRKFYLENEYGQQWDLNNLTTGFFNGPSGLGYEREASYARIGDRFIRNYIEDKQKSITGTVSFVRANGESPYVQQHAFTQYVNAAKDLKLRYITDSGEYYRDVDLVTFEKSEIDENGALQCGVSFTCRSLYYSNATDRFVVQRITGEYRFDARWPVRFSDYQYRRMTISNDGHVAAPFTLDLYGYLENPTIFVEQNGVEVARAVFPVTVELGEHIEYSSVDGDLYCRLVKNSRAVENIVPMLNIANENFFKLPVGSSQFNVTGNTQVTSRTIMTIFKYYRVV